jgi:sucrose-6-phosphate hydrolase SacC (GH32 family)
MSDGRRRVITGWVRDLEGEKDGGADRFGGDQCVPREIHEVAPGQLGFRPVPEALAQFPRVAGSLSTALPATAAAPDNYLLDASLQLDSDSEFTITLRRQSQPGSGYRLILRPAKHEAEMAGATFRFPRRVDLDCTRPIKLQIFVQGSIIECFLADTYAFTCRAYDDRSGSIAMKATGPAKIVSATIRIHD